MAASQLLPLFLVLFLARGQELSLHQVIQPLSRGEFPLPQQSASSCTTFMCKPANQTMPPNACIQFDNTTDTVYLQSCSSRTDNKTYCPSPTNGIANCTVKPSNTVESAWPGEKCTSNANCFSLNCSPNTGLCIGLSQGSLCWTTASCGPGLICLGGGLFSRGTCTALQGVGGSCTSQYQCMSNLGCNMTQQSTGVCTPYFSVPIGGTVTDCSSYSSLLCASGSCSQQGFNSIGTCMSPVTSSILPPHACQYNWDCVGTSGSLSFQSSCQCGYNPAGTSYCSPFLGDTVGRNSFYYLTRLMQNNLMQQCNTERRFNYNCISSLPITWGKSAIVFNMLFQNYPALQNNDNCIKDVYTAYYWSFNVGYVVAASAMVLGLF